LNVIIGESSSIFQLFTGKDQTLLLRRDTFFVLDLRLDILNRVVWLHIEGNSLSGQRLHKNLHRTSSQSQHQVQSRFLLDIVIRESSAILQLLSRENESLLLGRDTFFVLNLGLYILNRVIGFHIEGNRLSGQGFDENLHGTTSQSQHQVQSRFLLDVVIR